MLRSKDNHIRCNSHVIEGPKTRLLLQKEDLQGNTPRLENQIPKAARGRNTDPRKRSPLQSNSTETLQRDNNGQFTLHTFSKVKIPRHLCRLGITLQQKLCRSPQKNWKKQARPAAPSRLYNECLKDSRELLAEAWADLFDQCLKQSTIPEKLRYSIIRVLYKGKGNSEEPNSYRGIALENAALKLFSHALVKRLSPLVDSMIPEEQFGFRKG